MINRQKEYEAFIRAPGVGSNDKVADSTVSYVSYLNGVSRHRGIDIGPDALQSESDIERLVHSLEGKVSDKTVRNYRSAVRQYVAIVNEG